MPKIEYVPKTFRGEARDIIEAANRIIAEYIRQGYQLTLRQLYYQFVARDIIPNTVQSYKRLGSIINDGRLAGLIDWEAIEDRTRNLSAQGTWDSPGQIVRACAAQYRIDMWANQAVRPEVWVEKEALAGVVERAAYALRVPYLSCRGYVSQSEMWVAAMRLRGYRNGGQKPIVLHFGDHDPSGIDMTRDIRDRIELFMGSDIDLRRMALNMDQVEQYSPPPNPAKITDSRFEGYQRLYGDDSWELDALEPAVIAGLISGEISHMIDREIWDEDERTEQDARDRLREAAGHLDDDQDSDDDQDE